MDTTTNDNATQTEQNDDNDTKSALYDLYAHFSNETFPIREAALTGGSSREAGVRATVAIANAMDCVTGLKERLGDETELVTGQDVEALCEGLRGWLEAVALSLEAERRRAHVEEQIAHMKAKAAGN